MAYTAILTTASGKEVLLQMPNIYEVLARVGAVPSPHIAAILRLLEGTSALEQQNLLQRLAGQKEFYLGLYELFALMAVKPRLILRDTNDDGTPIAREEDDLTPADLSFNDVQSAYYSFFLSKPPTIVPTAGPALVNGITASAPAGDDISSAAKPGRRDR